MTPEYIDHYFDLGFKKVCTVKSTRVGNFWYYEDIDESIMYDEHRSWIYAITVHEKIVKFGETGNPLGIRTNKDNQPGIGTHNRLGRYRKNGNSDKTIRDLYRKQTQEKSNIVAFYALKCNELDYTFNMCDTSKIIKYQIHKQMEKFLLDYYKEKIGLYPESNSGRY